jgi:hypothetical protein
MGIFPVCYVCICRTSVHTYWATCGSRFGRNGTIFAVPSILGFADWIKKTFFSEGLGNPALEYMLCTNAARVAQAKGLHRRPADTWNLSKHDELHFSWLFWAIYCCEKHIAHRSGRPSVRTSYSHVAIPGCPSRANKILLGH